MNYNQIFLTTVDYLSNFFIGVSSVLAENTSFLTSQSLDSTFYTVLFINILFISLWALFFALYSSKKTVSFRFLIISFILGILVAFLAFFAEKLLLSSSLNISEINLSFLKDKISLLKYEDIIRVFLLSFFFIAVIEEAIKFFILKKIIAIKRIDQVVDGMKVGMYLGFGFAFIENIIYFIGFYPSLGDSFETVLVIFLLRGVLSTLAHALFGTIMGYYLVLAKFNKEDDFHFQAVKRQGKVVAIPVSYKPHIAKIGFFAAMGAHGYFNFFLMINYGVVSNIALILFLLGVLYWYGQKKNLKLNYRLSGSNIEFPVEVSDEAQKENLLTNNKLSEDQKRTRLLNIFSKQRK